MEITKALSHKAIERQAQRQEVQQNEVLQVRKLTRAEFINRLCPELPVFDKEIKEKAKMMGELPALSPEEKAQHIARIQQEQKGANECVNLVLSYTK